LSLGVKKRKTERPGKVSGLKAKTSSKGMTVRDPEGGKKEGPDTGGIQGETKKEEKKKAPKKL